jgi:glycosyltransferase involved in cell wall biosynthesis
MQQKIAIIVEPGFMQHHVGVRNYLFALHALLSREHRVDWVMCCRGTGGEQQWFHVHPKFVASDLGAAQETVVSGTPAAVLSLVDQAHQQGRTAHSDSWRTGIGSDLAVEGYDAIIISNPWLVDFDSRLPAARVLGIVYDLVPNQYVFTMPQQSKPLAFAAQHRRGFVYFREHCDAVLAISRTVADEYATAFGMESNRVVAMPPLLPASYGNVPEAANDRRRRVVLAGPFDRRKGADIMPAILNAARDSIDTVSIYGGVRCSGKELREFFKALEVRHVEWFPHAAAKTVHNLFLGAKALLFPSYDEGLGLPILESQYCGCRVLTRNKEPMRDLVGPGSGFVTADLAEAGAALARMVEEPFDHVGLQQWAQQSFGSRHVLDAVGRAIGWGKTEPAATLPLNSGRRRQSFAAEGRV